MTQNGIYAHFYSKNIHLKIHFGEEQTVLLCAMRFLTISRRLVNGAGKKGELKEQQKTMQTIAQWKQT